MRCFLLACVLDGVTSGDKIQIVEKREGKTGELRRLAEKEEEDEGMGRRKTEKWKGK